MASSAISVGIQSRIHVFESLNASSSSKPASKSSPNLLDTPNSPTTASFSPIVPSTSPSTPAKSVSRSPSPSPPILGRKTSLIDLKDWVLDDGPPPYVPRQKSYLNGNAGPSQNGGPNSRTVSDSVLRSFPSQSTPLIHLESPPRPKAQAPPLPPRKASYSSLQSVSVSNSSSSSLPRSPSRPPIPLPSQPRKKSDSLTVDHTYPPLAKLGIAIPRGKSDTSGHVPASSISSFHSVSLSSDGGTDPTTSGDFSNHIATFPMDQTGSSHGDDTELRHEPDNVSLDESFENVSASSAISPSVSSISHDWGEYIKRRPAPPKLPQRPKPPISLPTSPSSGSSSSPQLSPRLQPKHTPPPPPPPSRIRPPPSNRSSLASTITSTSDRSSVISTATSRTSLSSIRPILTPKPGSTPLQNQLFRPAPIPPTARTRYETVFVGNVLARHRAAAQERAKSPPPGRKARQAAGWRGLSVDLITNPEEHVQTPAKPDPIDEEVGPEERLDGRTVARIWRASNLDRAKLREIWSECDAPGAGSLDRTTFVKGMWRIDEELRKAHLSRHTSISCTSRRPNWKSSKLILR